MTRTLDSHLPPPQAAAHRDAAGTLPLDLAVRMGASEGVKDVLFEAYPEAITGMNLLEVLGWGARAVQHAIESNLEVIWGHIGPGVTQ